MDFKVSYCVVLYYSVHQFKASHYRPGQAFRAAGGEAPRIPRQRHMKVVKTHRTSLPRSRYSWYSSLLEDESTPGP